MVWTTPEPSVAQAGAAQVYRMRALACEQRARQASEAARPPCKHSLIAIGSLFYKWGILTMTGPRPAGRPWTAAEEARLGELLASGMKVGFIARTLKRSPGAIYARINSVRKTPRDLALAAQRLSPPSQRLLHAQASAESSQIDDTT